MAWYCCFPKKQEGGEGGRGEGGGGRPFQCPKLCKKISTTKIKDDKKSLQLDSFK